MFTKANNRQIYIAFVMITFLVSFYFFFSKNVAVAQLQIPGIQNSIIEFDPQFPKPGQKTTARVNDFTFDFSNQPIAWYINGVRRVEFDNRIEVTLRAPDLGKSLDILVISKTSSNERRVESTLTSSEVDIIVEGDTLTPYFYRGRSMPSVGSRVYVIAIPHLFDENGIKLSVEQLIFRWGMNSKEIRAGVGNQGFLFKMPEFSDTLLSLTIERVGGGVVYRTFSRLRLADSEIHFYEYSPLSGVSNNAILGNFLNTSKNEITLRAEPYFASSDIYTNAQTTWSLNGNVVEFSGGNKQMITLGGGGLSEIGYNILNPTTLLQSISERLLVNFIEGS